VDCWNCGADLSETARLCGACGVKQSDPNNDRGFLQAGGGAFDGDTPYRLAGFGVRFVAWFLDQLIANIAAMGVSLALGALVAGLIGIGDSDSGALADQARDDQRETVAVTASLLIFVLVSFLYHWISNATGAGPGKRLLRLRIVAVRNGGSPGAESGFIRTVVALLSGILYLGYLWWFVDDAHRTWHDNAAGTTVVHV
jgi:uncharacterized RDD family membrane protein YckC